MKNRFSISSETRRTTNTLTPKVRRTHLRGLVLSFSFSLALWAQTAPPPPSHGYLMPGDSIWQEWSLQGGDQVTWNLWLATGGANSGTTTLALWSSAEGRLWERTFGAESVSRREEFKAARPARYRLLLKADGTHGRAANLGIWTRYGPANRTPFPPPAVQRFAEDFAAGDRFVAECEFLFSDTIKLQTLRELELPKNLLSMWAITPSRDSVAATASVSRWLGDAGIIRLQERAPKGGTITLRLELPIEESGESTVYLEPGAHPPFWLPRTARLTTIHLHEPWRAVLVPPQDAVREAEPPRAPYAAQSFRARGLDSSLVRSLTEIYAERDSLRALRFSRRQTIAGYDTLFLTAPHALLPPDLHVVLATPLDPPLPARYRRTVSWFVDGHPEDVRAAKLYEWHFGEGRVAFPAARDEIFWDSTGIPLRPELRVHLPEAPARVAAIELPPGRARDTTETPRQRLAAHQSVWALFLENPTEDTLVLAWRAASEIVEPPLAAWKRWPHAARTIVIASGVLAALGVGALIEMRSREKRRRRHAARLDQQLEHARQTPSTRLAVPPPELKGVELYGLHQSLRSLGGDYHDFVPLEDGSVLLCVADAPGSETAAASLLAGLPETLRALAHTGKPLTEVMALLNRELFQRTSPGRYVTMLLAKVSADRSLVTVCNAGHSPGYIVRTSGNIVELDAGGTALGALDVFPFIQMDEGLDSGDMVVLYTDGIVNAEVGLDDVFGPDRLKHFLAGSRTAPLAHIAHDLFRRLTPEPDGRAVGSMAVVLLRVKPDRAADTPPRRTTARQRRT